MESLKIIIKLIRIKQWYKNIIIFLTTILGLMFFNAEVVMAYLLASILLYYYSAKPIRFKGIPLIDAVVGGGMFFISVGVFAYLMYGGTIASLVNNFPVGFLTLFIMGTAMLLVGAVFDMKYDKAGGINTSAVFFGWKIVLWFCVLISLLGVYLARENWFYLTLMLISVGLSGVQFSEKIRKSVVVRLVLSKIMIYFIFLFVLTTAILNIEILR